MSHNRELLATREDALFEQGENAALTYTVNWAGRLGGDTIATSTWTQETSGATIASESSTDITALARLSADPGIYLFTNKITLTTSGDTMEAQFKLRVKSNDSAVVQDYYNYPSYT